MHWLFPFLFSFALIANSEDPNCGDYFESMGFFAPIPTHLWETVRGMNPSQALSWLLQHNHVDEAATLSLTYLANSSNRLPKHDVFYIRSIEAATRSSDTQALAGFIDSVMAHSPGRTNRFANPTGVLERLMNQNQAFQPHAIGDYMKDIFDRLEERNVTQPDSAQFFNFIGSHLAALARHRTAIRRSNPGQAGEVARIHQAIAHRAAQYFQNQSIPDYQQHFQSLATTRARFWEN